MISGTEAEESETGTVEAGEFEDVAAGGCADGWVPVGDCPLFDDCGAVVDASPAAVGAAARAVAGCGALCVADCAGAGVCAGGVGVEPDCGAGGVVA